MAKKLFRLLPVLLVIILAWQPAEGAQDQKNLTINATVNARAKLTLSVTAINFPDADPDATPSLAANENPVGVTANVRTGSGSTATLTVLANSDLVSGSDSIGIGNVSWTATGSGFVNGVLSKTTAQNVGSWTGSGVRTGTLNFFLANSWDYATGNYSATATFTLTAP